MGTDILAYLACEVDEGLEGLAGVDCGLIEKMF